jgi:excisionase family DNA binding protein
MQQAIADLTTPAPALRGYMTTGQAARLIGVSLQTIKNWVKSGRLEGEPIGGRVLVRRASIQRFLDQLAPALTTELEPLSEEELNAAEGEQEAVVAALPPEVVQRVEALVKKRDTEGELSPEEQRELQRLVAQGSRMATGRPTRQVPRRRGA